MAGKLYEKTHNIIDNNGKHNRAKTCRKSAKSSLCRKLFCALCFHWINSLCHRKGQSFKVKTFLWNLAWCRAQLGSVVRHLRWGNGFSISPYLPLLVNRSLRASFTFMQVLVWSYMMVTHRSRMGITLSTTSTTGAFLRAWKSCRHIMQSTHAFHAVLLP